jgi:putative nucleotidyltransferase with HDIG domain
MLRTIRSEQLLPGMYVSRLLGPWMQHPFWRSSFLADSDDIARIRASVVTHVVIDTVRGHVAVDAASDDETTGEGDDQSAAAVAGCCAGSAGRTPRRRHAGTRRRPARIAAAGRAPADRRRDRHRPAHLREGADTVRSMFQEVRLGNALNAEAVLPMVVSIRDSVMRNPHALISVARLKTADNYTYLHSVAVSALMTVLARQLGLSDEDTMVAALGGLLHDMGKAAVPPAILNKPGRLTDGEFDVIRRHPEQGQALLVAAGLNSRPVLDIVLHHHEKIDGTGYPQRLAGDAIPRLAKMGAVCDVYDAITSNRPYKQGWDPAESLKRMATWEGHFDPAIFQPFVKSLGIYPVGSLVRLASDHLAVVIEQNPASLLTPRVRLFYSIKHHRHVLMQDIDLGAEGGRDRIVGLESPEKWDFRELEKVWMA